jgi:hypothetical protein
MGVGPWAICIGIFFVLPLASFALGYKIGKGDIPLRIVWGETGNEFEI